MQAVDDESRLFEIIHTHSTPFPRGKVWDFRLRQHPADLLAAVKLLRGIPRVSCAPSDTSEGRLIRGALQRQTAGIATAIHQATNTLVLPDEPGRYDQGHERATQRRKARQAARVGVTWRAVQGEDERVLLQKLATEWEQANPRELYRNAEPDTVDLLEVDLWLAAFVDERPVLLSVTAVDGQWSVLRYFRTLEDTDASSTARYLMTGALAETLVSRGVRYLCDPVSPFRLPRGLLHFSRMVGFRIIRVDVTG